MYAIYDRITGMIGKKSPSKKKTKNRCKALQAHANFPKEYIVIEIDKNTKQS